MSDYRTEDSQTGEASQRASRLADAAKTAASDATAKVRSEAATLKSQAGDSVRSYAVQGKDKASGLLDELAAMLNDAASQVDEKLGSQYGGYARQAADAVSDFSRTLRDRDVDDIADDARSFVRKSPGVAIGAAAAIGFVLARIVKTGFDEAKTLGTEPANDRDVAFRADPAVFPDTGTDGSRA